MKKHGYLERIVELLKKNRVESVVYDKIMPNPWAEHVDEGAAVAREESCDFIL
jgi:alcohol dehydrogenase